VTFGLENSFQVHLKFNFDWEDSPSQQRLHYYQLAEGGREGMALLRSICRHGALHLLNKLGFEMVLMILLASTRERLLSIQ